MRNKSDEIYNEENAYHSIIYATKLKWQTFCKTGANVLSTTLSIDRMKFLFFSLSLVSDRSTLVFVI